jgi:uncharacterized protein (TIGR02246 family)
MPKTRIAVATGLALVALAGCSTAPPPAPAVDTATEAAKIRDMESTEMKDIAAKDVDKVMNFYADDATLMTPGAPAAKGKDEIRKAFAGMAADPNFKLDFSAQRIEVGKGGDVAFSQGTYTLTMTDAKTKKPMTEKGSYVTGYKKQADGNWKAVSDINVSE